MLKYVFLPRHHPRNRDGNIHIFGHFFLFEELFFPADVLWFFFLLAKFVLIFVKNVLTNNKIITYFCKSVFLPNVYT